MENFNGTFVQFDANTLKLNINAKSEESELALLEVQLFKKVLNLSKREINEQIRIIKSNAASTLADIGPASLDTGALLFRGTRLASLCRIGATARRASVRNDANDQVQPLENDKRIIQKLLLAVDGVIVQLQKNLLEASK